MVTDSPEIRDMASPMPPQAPPTPPLSSLSPISTYVKPQPRPPKSPAHSAQIRVQNRRREYLERNLKYFDSLDHEHPDPLLYDALIRRFQSPAEREAEGRTKGYSRVLEVDLIRGEAKIAQLTSATFAANITTAPLDPAPRPSDAAETWIPKPASEDADAFIREYASGSDGFGDDGGGNVGAETEVGIKGLLRRPETREEGRERWNDFLRRRFVLGRDDDFDYQVVDENDDLDVIERREQEDAWFDDEDPDWATDPVGDQGGRMMLEGETGIQDF
ncbi:coiled-coil domain-containing protein-domain-containing protein [Annulohypoxylon maeteangense]|uniref:coiled-coil domain-containing protein-domain-containing protein n=1 Tax=Annulohypoxylon maeteangense TaxID=1927788 RepID=UPI0020076489|nr:coiled-coil domain-containing protein-domain-containing protein [Annulohypoxylon maeteangense]KAI0885989.1 coiled-coil domain-containing protein-domain-containing protein [Annulohypoxylon maeteangense]